MQILPEGENDLDNLYAPARIRFDGSSSKAKTGGISKFIYDFGEGRAPSEGDAVQTYEYRIPGEYIVKLTAVTDGGERAIQSRKIIIKEIPKKVGITSSISEARIGKTVEFSSNGTVGQIDTYEWNFGDGTESSREANPVHIFEKAGTFTVVLTVTYTDGTVRTSELEQKVGE